MIIKKLNSVFHRHSRWLFGLITIVIIISFIGFMVPGSFFGFGPENGSSMRVGTAFGKKVTYEDLRDIHRNLEVCNQLGFPVGETRIEQQFFFYCMLLKAESVGISASDKEIASTLKNHPMLQSNGKFDMKKYNTLLTNLNRFGITKQEVEASLRMMLIITKLQNQLGAAVIATPGEARELFRHFNTTYELKIAEFQTGKAAKLVKPNAVKLAELPAAEQKAVVQYFNANSKKYTIPGWLDVMVVEFPNKFFIAQAAKKATEKELLKFYNANKNLFTGKDGKVPAFAAVKAKVRDEFIKLESTDLAQRAAEDFAVDTADAAAAVDKMADKIKAFRKAADSKKLAVVENPKVPFTASNIGSINSANLVQALNQVAGNPVTKVVVTPDSACVGFLRGRTETRLAQLDEVLAQVRADKTADELYKATRKKAEDSYIALRKLKGANRNKAFDTLKGVKFTNLKFTLAEPATDPKFQQAMMTAMNMKVGDIAAPLPNLQMVKLVARKAPDYKNYAGKESQYQMILRMQKSQQLQAAFMEEISTRCQLDPSITAERQ
ncbi:MAG: SurA N-terminal domain-containing protein [Lentisphaeria bacterium]|nr:SurA N-terminal domain-containing protein [Lentisphaeria bacterium]